MKYFALRPWSVLTWAVTSLWFLFGLWLNIPKSPTRGFLDWAANSEFYRDSGATVVSLGTGFPLNWSVQHWSLDGQHLATFSQPLRLLVNFVSVSIAIFALIWLLQVYAQRISIKFLLGGTAVVAILLTVGRYLAIRGYGAATMDLIVGIYFFPVILVVTLGLWTWLRPKFDAMKKKNRFILAFGLLFAAGLALPVIPLYMGNVSLGLQPLAFLYWQLSDQSWSLDPFAAAIIAVHIGLSAIIALLLSRRNSRPTATQS